MNISTMIIKKYLPLPQIESFDRFLFVGPHPDDVEIGAGATIAKLAAMGKKICILICTDGRYGNGFFAEGTPYETVIETRIDEAKKAASLLGISDVRFLGLSDGGFYSNSDLLRGIAGVISDFQPDIIFGPDPSINSECHIDHLNVGKAVRTLACFGSNPGIMAKYGNYTPSKIQAIAFYMTVKTNVYVNTTGYYETQMNAILNSHLSQFPVDSQDRKDLIQYLKIRSKKYGLTHLCKDGEGFRILGHSHSHCMPEMHV